MKFQNGRTWYVALQAIGAFSLLLVLVVSVFAPNVYYQIVGDSNSVSPNLLAINIRNLLTMFGIGLFAVGYFVEGKSEGERT